MSSQFNSYIDSLDLSAATDFCRKNGVPCHYKKGERFVQQGTVARYAALVVSGYFKVVTLKDSGDEAVVNLGQAEISVHLLNPGEWSVKN